MQLNQLNGPPPCCPALHLPLFHSADNAPYVVICECGDFHYEMGHLTILADTTRIAKQGVPPRYGPKNHPLKDQNIW